VRVTSLYLCQSSENWHEHARDHDPLGRGDDCFRANTQPPGFEAASEEDVTSPTFTLVHEYRGPLANLYHIDLYRVDTPRQLETLGLDDLVAEDSILLIEWGEKFPRLVRERDVEIAIDRRGESERRIRIFSR
jgi:tRNA threonylcarbamoyl adenosine modification protein YjeE